MKNFNQILKKDFAQYSRQFKSGELTKTAWRPAKLFRSQNDPYTKGFAELALTLFRKRVAEKEKGTLGFQGILPKNVWDTRLKVSQSLRTQKYDEALNLKPIYEDYRKGKGLISYKNKTFQTSVNQQKLTKNSIVPFVHSQNLHRAQLQNIRPINPKVYPKTMKGEFNHLLWLKPTEDSYQSINFPSKRQTVEKLNLEELKRTKTSTLPEQSPLKKQNDQKDIQASPLKRKLTNKKQLTILIENQGISQSQLLQSVSNRQTNKEYQRKKQVALEMSRIHSLEADLKQNKEQAIEKCVEIYFKNEENN